MKECNNRTNGCIGATNGKKILHPSTIFVTEV